MQGGKNRKNFFLKTLVYVPAMVLKTTTTQVNRKVGNSTPPSALPKLEPIVNKICIGLLADFYPHAKLNHDTITPSPKYAKMRINS